MPLAHPHELPQQPPQPQRRRLVLGAATACAALAGSHPVLGQARADTTAGVLTVAAASDLRYALDELLQALRSQTPGIRVDVVYGSSGKLSTQLLNGAPFDLFFSADHAYAQAVFASGRATHAPVVYATGRLATASRDPALAGLSLRELVRHGAVKRFALANPTHAPYGQRAREALQHQGLWNELQPRLVLGDNVTQAAQFIDSGAAQAGIVAVSLVLAPAVQGRLHWRAVPEGWHSPLRQAWVLMKTASTASQQRAGQLLALLQSPSGQALMQRHGFQPAAAR